MEETVDPSSKAARRKQNLEAKAARLLQAPKRMKEKIVARAQTLRATLKDLPPFPGND